jgi:hypothetical protein
VIQPSLEPYLSSLSPAYHVPNANHHLLAFRLTTLQPSQQSVLGITWAHILGDASALNLFTRHLSWIYSHPHQAAGLGSEEDSQRPPLPTFSPHVDFPPEVYPPGDTSLLRYKISQITPTYPSREASVKYGQDARDSERITISLSRADLGCLVKMINGSAGASAPVRLSVQDVLSAWWIHMLQRLGVSVHRIIYTINVSDDIPLRGTDRAVPRLV